MTQDPFYHQLPDSLGLVRDMFPVTPDDSNDNTGGSVATGIYIEVGGTIVFNTRGGDTRTVIVPANFYLICSVTRVLFTGTTASGIHALIM